MPRNILLKLQKGAFEIGKHCKVQQPSAALSIASLGIPNFWPESSLSKTMTSPQCHVLPQVSPWFWTCSERVCPPAVLSSCSQLLPPASDLLKATWEIPHLVRDFLKQTVYIWLILPADLKKTSFLINKGHWISKVNGRHFKYITALL